MNKTMTGKDYLILTAFIVISLTALITRFYSLREHQLSKFDRVSEKAANRYGNDLVNKYQSIFKACKVSREDTYMMLTTGNQSDCVINQSAKVFYENDKMLELHTLIYFYMTDPEK